MGTRAEHLAWAKTRALAYVDQGDTNGAMASFVSDMRKHDDTADVVKGAIASIGLMCAASNEPSQMRRWIEGFH